MACSRQAQAYQPVSDDDDIGGGRGSLIRWLHCITLTGTSFVGRWRRMKRVTVSHQLRLTCSECNIKMARITVKVTTTSRSCNHYDTSIQDICTKHYAFVSISLSNVLVTYILDTQGSFLHILINISFLFLSHKYFEMFDLLSMNIYKISKICKIIIL